ncbi:MAG: transcription termination factor Rho, partial [Bacteroidales bacterium]|nr:transcription termination factor Rho [Bacteroidales bacterium]
MIYNIIELNEKLTTELRILAKEMGIRRPDAYKKEELIYKILDEQAIAETQKIKPNTPDKPKDKPKPPTKKKQEAPKSTPKKEDEQKQKQAPPKQNQNQNKKAAPTK